MLPRFLMKLLRYAVLLLLTLTACLPEPLPAQAPRDVRTDQRLLLEHFDTVGSWDTYADSRYTINVAEGYLNMFLRDAGIFMWTTNRQLYENVVIELDLRWLSDAPTAMAGVVCRLSSSGDGTGYYVLVSHDGSYSIRYGGSNRDEALVRWQPSRRVPSDDQTLNMRVICVNDYIALYINDQYVDGAEDHRLRRGYLGLVTGLPPVVSAEASAAIQVDTLRVWRGTFAD